MNIYSIGCKITYKLVLAHFFGWRKMTQYHKKEAQITQNQKKHTLVW